MQCGEELCSAAKDGELNKIKLLLSKGCDVNAKNKYGKLALTTAAYWGHLEIVKFILELGVDVDQPDADGNTALMSAARKPQIELIKFLLSRGSNPNKKTHSGATALMSVAICEGMQPAKSEDYSKVAKLLLLFGADPNLFDKSGATALIRSLFDKRVEFIKLLLQAGADPTIGNLSGRNAIEIAKDRAFDHQYEEIAQLFFSTSSQSLKSQPNASIEPQSGLIFPNEIKEWAVIAEITVYGGDLGASIAYEHPVGWEADVYVYDYGYFDIRDGIESRIVQTHFEFLKEEMIQHAERVLSPFKDSEYESAFGHKVMKWLCTYCEVIMNSRHQRSWIYLTGWNGYFVKIRHTYPIELVDSASKAIGDLMNGLSAAMCLQLS